MSGHRLSTAEVESALILHKGVAETAVVGSHDEITGQAVFAFVTMKPEFDFQATKEADLNKELAIQVRKVIGPFAAPKKIVRSHGAWCTGIGADVRQYLVDDLPKTRSGKIVCGFVWLENQADPRADAEDSAQDRCGRGGPAVCDPLALARSG